MQSLADQDTPWHEAPPNTATTSHALVHYLDLESLAHREGRTSPALVGVTGPHPIGVRGKVARLGADRPGTPGADVRNVHAVTPQSTFLNHA
jgi:hypothetical protein